MAIAKVAGKSTGRATSVAGASATPKLGYGDQQLAAMGLKLGSDGHAYPVKDDKPAPTPAPALPSKSARPNPPAGPLTDPPAVSRPRPAPRSTAGSGDGTISGFLLGLLGTAVFINFMRGGTPQVRQWVDAKFTNTVVAPAAAATPGGSGKPGLPGAGAPTPPSTSGGGASGGGGRSW